MDQNDFDGGKLLVSLRQGAKLSQAELAKRAAISRSMIAQLEIGERRPSQKIIHILCEAMNVSSEKEQELLAAYNFLPSGQTPDQIMTLLRSDKKLTAEQVEKIASLVRDAYLQATSENLIGKNNE